MKQKTKITTLATLLALAFILIISRASALTDVVYIDDYTIKASYTSANEGDTFNLNIEINNSGNAKKDVEFELDDRNPFDSQTDTNWDIGNLNKSESVSKTFRIEIDSGTTEGKYKLDFTLKDSSEDYDDNFEIEVSSESADFIIGNVNSFPEIIQPDQKNIKLDIDIENIGGGKSEFTRAKIILPQGFSSSQSYSDFTNLETINSGERKTASFFIDTDSNLNPGTSQGKIQLDFKTDSDQRSQTLYFDLPVKGRPQFQILSSQTNPSKVMQGETADLKITISNIGSEDGEETSIKVFENTDIPLSFNEKTKFIGTLNSGESGTGILQFDADSDAVPNTYLVKVQVRSVSNSNIFTEEFNVPVLIVAKQTDYTLWFFVIAGIVFILLIILIVWLLKRR